MFKKRSVSSQVPNRNLKRLNKKLKTSKKTNCIIENSQAFPSTYNVCETHHHRHLSLNARLKKESENHTFMLDTWFSWASRFMPLSRVANWWRQLCVLILTACQCLDTLSLLHVKRDGDEDVCVWWWWLAFRTEYGSDRTKDGRQSSFRGKGFKIIYFYTCLASKRKIRKRFSHLFLYEKEVYSIIVQNSLYI